MEKNNRKGYKAFYKGLICKPDKDHVKQYAENTDFEEEGGTICGPGMMHYCANPLDTWRFAPLVDDDGNMAEFAAVEALEEPVTDDGFKFATKRLHVGGKISLRGIVEAGVSFALDSSTLDLKDGSSGYAARIGSSGDDAHIGSSGRYARIGSSGYAASIGSSGADASIGSSGYAASIGSSGRYAHIGSSGYAARIGSSGYAASIGSSGRYARIGSSGRYARIGSSGDGTRCKCEAPDGVIMCAGRGSMARGCVGTWITLAEFSAYDGSGYPCLWVKSARIDGEKLKADTWYTLKDGEFVEVPDDEQ